MSDLLTTLLSTPTLVTLASAVAGAVLVRLSGAVRFIPNHSVGIVERLIGGRAGAGGIIALGNEAGFRPDVLRGGLHAFMPFVYRIHVLPLVTIPQGQIGYVFARDGRQLPSDQAMASNREARDFQDARAFLRVGGQRGPQRLILREGTYAINLALFVVITADAVLFLPLDAGERQRFTAMSATLRARGGFAPVVIPGDGDAIGIVTVHDGPTLPSGEIVAPTVGEAGDPASHNAFQDPERFLAAGGRRGRQLQVLVEGTYHINRLFATVEAVPKTVIEVGTVGVVVSYTGGKGADRSGEAYSHGELVDPGKRGVCSDPLLPGKYAFNTYAAAVVVVPTTNIILKWIRAESGAHRLDENLAEISLITKDAFEPSLPLSVVVHIDYRKAPLVVQRFGDIKRLVEQTLDPMVSAYFKNIGQTRTLIELIHDRATIQQQASEDMHARFARYNLELEEVLIGTPTAGKGAAIEQILDQLRLRQIATEQVETYAQQQRSAGQERELREAEARARSQQRLTESELAITVQANEGRAQYQRALQEAERIRALAQAEADRTRYAGVAEADRVKALAGAEAERAARVGVAQALAVEEQVRAYGGPRLQLAQQVLTRFAEAIERGHIPLVPQVVLGGGAGGTPQAGQALEALLGLLLSEKLGIEIAPPRAAGGAGERLRTELAAAIAPKPEGA